MVGALRAVLKPDGGSDSGSTGEVLRFGPSVLLDGDLAAIAHYLMKGNRCLA